MKKLILISIAILIITKQYAQIEKGTTLPGFSLSGMYSKTHSNSGTFLPYYDNSGHNYQLGVNLKYGKFVKDNLLVGFNVGYGYNSREYDVNYQSSYPNIQSKSRQNGINAGLYLLKYRFITDNFCITYGASFNLAYTESNNNDIGATQSYDTMGVIHYSYYSTTSFDNTAQANINLTAGINYFVTKNLAITGSIGFFSANYTAYPYLKKNKEIEQNSINLNLLATYNAFGAGLVYFIRPKKK
jgi:hypothetical protein